MLRNLFCLGNLAVLVLFSGDLSGQSFSSGSNGSDGALSLTTPGTIIFDPKGLTPPRDTDGDNVYHFTTINIGPGVTVKLSSKVLSGPVHWLAQGNVTLNGTIDLSGESGHIITSNSSQRVPAAGGAGGYSGGVGGIQAGAGGPVPQAGNGPGAGAVPTGTSGNNATFTGSQYLIPLIGGTGGSGGANAQAGTFGGGGGAGGGAILIASSTLITITPGGGVRANGGEGGSAFACQGSTPCGGGGSGGAVRLIAPAVSILGDFINNANPRGAVSAYGGGGFGTGFGFGTGGSLGKVRLETFTPPGAINFDAFLGQPVIVTTPFSTVVPSTPPSSIKVTTINGVPINANPFSFPDTTINSSVPVIVNVQAQFIPIGTVPKIIVMSEIGPDQTVNCSAPLQGTLQQSTCNALITFPTGGSRGFVKATWTQ
jgi:hypothetical protein